MFKRKRVYAPRASGFKKRRSTFKRRSNRPKRNTNYKSLSTAAQQYWFQRSEDLADVHIVNIYGIVLCFQQSIEVLVISEVPFSTQASTNIRYGESV